MIIMMNKKILVAMDGSDTSEFVFEQAIRIAKEYKSSLKLLHVLTTQDQSLSSLESYSEASPDSEMTSNLHDRPTSNLSEMNVEDKTLRRLVGCVERAKASQIDADYICMMGDPGQTICDLALSWHADLILLGGEAQASDRASSLNSVRNFVTHNAPCSVEVVRLSRDPQSFSALGSETLFAHLSGWQ